MTTLYEFIIEPTDAQKNEIGTILESIIKQLSYYPSDKQYYFGLSLLPKHTSQETIANLKSSAEAILKKLHTEKYNGMELLELCNGLYQQLDESGTDKIFTNNTRAHLIVSGVLSLLRVCERTINSSFSTQKEAIYQQITYTGMHAQAPSNEFILISTIKSILDEYFKEKKPLTSEDLKTFKIHSNFNYPLDANNWRNAFTPILGTKTTMSNSQEGENEFSMKQKF